MSGKGKKKKTSTAPKKDTPNKITIKNAVLGAILCYVLYQAALLGYVGYRLSTAASGSFGTVIAVTDEMDKRFPLQFVLFQRLADLPFPNPAAKAYYEEQKDFFEQAARDFELHPYWSYKMEAKEGMNFREVVTERMRSMHRQFQESGRMDYRLEKDRCAQFEFLRRNNIAHPEIKKMWYDRDELLNDVNSGAAVKMMDNWPIFFKACHLTQRSSLGTFGISSPEKFEANKQDLIDWINDKWDYRSRDVDRPWQAEGDALTDALTPSILVQEPMTESKGDKKSSANFELTGRIASGLVEIKVEVFWGKVYIMQMDATTVFLRNNKIEDYTTFTGGVLHRPGGGNKHTSWIRDGGYLDCVIETAERFAQAAHIEYVRVDLFLDNSNPDGCVVNEISLSSGYKYYGHEEYMAKLWAGPLEKKLYKTFDKYSTQVHELEPEKEEQE